MRKRGKGRNTMIDGRYEGKKDIGESGVENTSSVACAMT